DARDLAQSGVRLLGCLGIHTGANAAFLRARLQGRTRRLVARPGSTSANQLIECWHCLLLLKILSRTLRQAASAESLRRFGALTGFARRRDSTRTHNSGAGCNFPSHWAGRQLLPTILLA